MKVVFAGYIKLSSSKVLEASGEVSTEILIRSDNLITEILNKLNILQYSERNKQKKLMIFLSDEDMADESLNYRHR